MSSAFTAHHSTTAAASAARAIGFRQACNAITSAPTGTNTPRRLSRSVSIVMALQAWRNPIARAALAAAVLLWCAVNALDMAALIREYRSRPLVDYRLVLADDLVARGVTSARAPFRAAYHVTFLAGERVRTAATDFTRIRAYTEEAARTAAPTISDTACAQGTPLNNGQYLCP